jgi:putative transposase
MPRLVSLERPSHIPRSKHHALPALWVIRDARTHEGAERTERTERIALGYRTFRCAACERRFNERTGTPFTYSLDLPTDIVLLAVRWRLRYTLRLRDVAELLLDRRVHRDPRSRARLRGALHAGAERAATGQTAGQGRRFLAAFPGSVLRPIAKFVGGVWWYLYRAIDHDHRAIDRDGHLIDSMLRATRDREAAQRFFEHAQEVVGHTAAGGSSLLAVVCRLGALLVPSCGDQ